MGANPGAARVVLRSGPALMKRKGGREVRTLLAVAVLAGVAGAATADTLVVLNKSDATASLIDLAKGTAVATLPTGQAPHEVDVSPDGKRALVANYGTREA